MRAITIESYCNTFSLDGSTCTVVGAAALSSAKIRASAILANDFHDAIVDLAKHGWVLVLLDACHSGGFTADGSALTSNADLLRSTMAVSR
jgi:hypothetical protein